MASYDLLIFDWDGTLCDSIERIIHVMQAAAKELGLPARSASSIKAIIGLGLPEAISTLYPELEGEAVESFRQCYSQYFILHDQEPSPLFDGVTEALQAFRSQGYWLAVATGKSRQGLNRALASKGLSHFFDVTRCADETASKPDPLMLNEILAHCSTHSSRALMIGDAAFDLEMARRAQMDSVAVSYGAQPSHVLRDYKPRMVIDHFNELRTWLVRSER
ncbi:phosphoglycolate phosphatase [Pseudomonas duriflava]|uniref:Phosphoglycolate phosphatase n=1 Tax=Pseudomonas duriflava TaxID=459528 RepID=A0A562QBL1_9PSED|nr:HAD-IA family hydrolase [Pseudomonas duriflava]TWI53416.1 phosphoglycolate phosphatase [Pseudomonas duriflava]